MEWIILIGIVIGAYFYFKKKEEKIPTKEYQKEEQIEQNTILKKVSDDTYTISLNMNNFKLGDKPNKLEPTTNQPLKLNLSVKNPKNDLIKRILETKNIKGKYYTHGYWESANCVIVDFSDDKVLGCLILDDKDENIIVERVFHIKTNNGKFRFESEGLPFDYDIKDFKEEKEFKVTLFNHKREKYKI